MDKVKKIYARTEALVSDDVINASDSEIDAEVYEAEPGAIIYNADLSVIKQKGLDGAWVNITTSNP